MGKAASGTGTIRKKTVQRNGKTYTYWEARYTTGYNPGTGRQIQRSITGKTQKEVAQKLKAATAAIDAGTYQAPCKLLVSEWLETWTENYLGGVKPRTVDSYKSIVRNHLIPAFGAVRLEALTPDHIQAFYNGLSLSPKTVKNVHGILHKALEQAVKNRYIPFNPAEACVLPKRERTEIKPLDEQQITAFLGAIKGHRLEYLFLVTLFTGMREGEVLGLTWDAVNLTAGTITVNKQLQKERGGSGEYRLVSTKNGKGRTITIAPFVVATLRKVRVQQSKWKLCSLGCWDNSMNLVFTDELGGHLCAHTVYHRFKDIAASIGLPEARFHDLRHSYAVAALRSGDDIKTVQGNLGHATASFTLDVYGHVTDQMKQASADRMERFIQSVSG